MAHSLDRDELTRRRQKAGLTVEQLAKRAGVPLRTVNYALAGRAVQAGTLEKLHAALVGVEESPLLSRSPVEAMSPAAMAKHDQVELAKLERQAQQRQELAKAAGDVGARLRAADAQRVALRKQAEGLDDLAERMAGETPFSKAEVVDQLLAVHPELIEPYDEVRRERLVKDDRRPDAPLGRDLFGEPVTVEVALSDDPEWTAREAALRVPSSTEAVRKADADLQDTSPAPRGLQELYNAARTWAARAKRSDLLAGELDDLIAAYLASKGGRPAPAQKAERVQLAKVDYDAWIGFLGSPAGHGWVVRDLARVGLAKASKVMVPPPDRYENGIAMVDPAAKHGFIAHADSPGKCALCDGDLGDERHWMDARP